MIVVHHLEKSRSHRIIWLLEELGLSYEVVRYQRDPVTLLAPPELKAVHPLGRAPVVVEDGQVLSESGAIIETLLDRHDTGGRLRPPPGSPARVDWYHWMHFAEGSAMSPLLLTLVFARIREARMPFFARPVARSIAERAMRGFVGPQLRANGDYIDAALRARPWFAGDAFSAADIQMSFPLQAMTARTDISALGAVQDWLRRIEARDAWRRTVERVGPLALLG